MWTKRHIRSWICSYSLLYGACHIRANKSEYGTFFLRNLCDVMGTKTDWQANLQPSAFSCPSEYRAVLSTSSLRIHWTISGISAILLLWKLSFQLIVCSHLATPNIKRIYLQALYKDKKLFNIKYILILNIVNNLGILYTDQQRTNKVKKIL